MYVNVLTERDSLISIHNACVHSQCLPKLKALKSLQHLQLEKSNVCVLDNVKCGFLRHQRKKLCCSLGPLGGHPKCNSYDRFVE